MASESLASESLVPRAPRGGRTLFNIRNPPAWRARSFLFFASTCQAHDVIRKKVDSPLGASISRKCTWRYGPIWEALSASAWLGQACGVVGILVCRCRPRCLQKTWGSPKTMLVSWYLLHKYVDPFFSKQTPSSGGTKGPFR